MFAIHVQCTTFVGLCTWLSTLRMYSGQKNKRKEAHHELNINVKSLSMYMQCTIDKKNSRLIHLNCIWTLWCSL